MERVPRPRLRHRRADRRQRRRRSRPPTRPARGALPRARRGSHAAEAKDEADREAGIERLGGGQWQLVVSEIPYMVQKGKLIEQIAQADRRPQAADPRGRARRERRADPPRARAQEPQRRSRAAQGIALQADRPRNAASGSTSTCSTRTRTPGVHGAARAAAQNWVAHQIDILQRRSRHRLREDRRPARAGRRLHHRLPQPRPDDRDHPHRGRAQAGDDGRVRADRPPGRGDPQHAAAQLAQARGDGAAQGARRRCWPSRASCEKLLDSPARQRTRLKRDLAALRKDYAEDTALGRRRTTIAEAAPARRVQHGRDDREGAGDGDPLAARLDPRGARATCRSIRTSSSRKATARPSRSTRRPPTSCCSPPTTGGSTPSAPTSCPARAGSASRSATMLDIDAERADRRADRAQAGDAAAARLDHRPAASPPMTDELLAETRKGRQVVNLKPGVKLARRARDRARARSRRGGRRQPQAGGVQPRGAAGHGARAGRDAAALPRRRAGRRDHVQARGRPVSGRWAAKPAARAPRRTSRMWKVARGAAGRLPPQRVSAGQQVLTQPLRCGLRQAQAERACEWTAADGHGVSRGIRDIRSG